MKTVNRAPHDITYEFTREYVKPCRTDGYCNLVQGIEREEDTRADITLTKDGPHRSIWRYPPQETRGFSTVSYMGCIGCLHPIGYWDTKRVNDYFGHEAETYESFMSSLPKIVSLDDM